MSTLDVPTLPALSVTLTRKLVRDALVQGRRRRRQPGAAQQAASSS